jgi:methionyl-tRNA formyltransferase
MLDKRIIFMGTPEISSFYLKTLIDEKYNIIAVYSQPPKKKGRGMIVQESHVHKLANAKGIEVLNPIHFNSDEVKQSISNFHPDLIIVMGYGIKLPNFILNLPPLGCINIHVSLLPRWRGASPIEHALMQGDYKTGITIFKLIDEMDAGPIIASKSMIIDKALNKNDLTNSLNIIGINLLKSVLPNIFKEQIIYKKQDLKEITYAPKITSNMRKLDFNESTDFILNKVRAFSPKPGAWFLYANERIKIISCKVEKGKYATSTIINKQFHIGCIDGKICPEIIQREGKNQMKLEDFLRGFDFKINTEVNA